MYNDQKQKINETWMLRAHIIYFVNGVKGAVQSGLGIFIYFLISAPLFSYFAYLIVLSYHLSGTEHFKNTLRIWAFWVVFLSFTVLYFTLGGKPRGASISKFLRVGFCNKAGETPLLMETIHTSDVVTYVFRNCGLPLSTWQDKKEDLESILNLNITDIEEAGKKRIMVSAVSGSIMLPKFIEWNSKNLSLEDFELVCGKSYYGNETINLAITPHALIGGSTGSGKSVLLKLLLMQCIQKKAEVSIIDFKGGVDFSADIWKDNCKIATDMNSTILLLKGYYDEMKRRQALLSKTAYSDITEYNNFHFTDSLPRIVIGCDEVAELLDKTGSDKKRKEEIATVESYLSSIARLGRACSIHLLLATQRPDANVISGQIKNNVDIRICGRADDVLSQIILDKTDASDLISKNSQGRFLNQDDIIFQAYWFDDKRMEKYER